jgi:ribosomal protein S8
MPSSRIKVEIAKVLKQEGYIRDYAVSRPTSAPS